MTQLVQPRLVNPPEGDPGLYLDFRFGKRAMLFDLGDLSPLTPRELLRVSHAFVSHAHMDHVAGLDRLLRVRLHRPRPLCVLGPEGFVRQVENRLGAFSWNLLDGTSTDFRLSVQEFDGQRIMRAAEFRARDAFCRRDLVVPDQSDGGVLTEADFTVEAVALDHGIPSLAFAFQESRRVTVCAPALAEMGLPAGPWLETAKSAIRRGAADDYPVDVPGHATLPLGVLRGPVLMESPGQRVVYVTDAADTESNRARIVRLARGANHLFVETPFLDGDRDIATATAHLTAQAAGEIAHAAGARRVTGFHHSARYADRRGALDAELAEAFGQDGVGASTEPNPEGDPSWVRRWGREGISTAVALARFDSLPPVTPEEMLGHWRGVGMPTGHPLDGLLERLGWNGKRFESLNDVDPLVFGPGLALDPRLMPVGIALRWPRLAKSAAASAAFRLVRPVLRARGPAARLGALEFRGLPSAAMIYDRQPIVDHFRFVDTGRVLGLMEMRGAEPYFFLLTKVPAPGEECPLGPSEVEHSST